MPFSSILTFANGQHQLELPPGQTSVLFRRFTNQLNGHDRAWLLLTRLPDSSPVHPTSEYEHPSVSHTFIQCAGKKDAITVEVRERIGDDFNLSTLSRRTLEESSPLSVEIPFGDRTINIKSSEVFSSDEAAEIFHRYYLDGTVDESYMRRVTETTRS